MEDRDPDSYPCQVTLSASSTFRATNRACFHFKLWLQGILLQWSGLWSRINRHCIILGGASASTSLKKLGLRLIMS